ncbi:MAG: hypothetical protein J5814_06700 [Bacteroidaceae bacterium]|nr:hypothetical protein [Bacteroidaceae bacterium]
MEKETSDMKKESCRMKKEKMREEKETVLPGKKRKQAGEGGLPVNARTCGCDAISAQCGS